MIRHAMLSFVGFFLVFVVSFAVLPAPAAHAAVDPNCKSSSLLGLPQWFEYLDVGPKNGDPCAIYGPANADQSFDWERAVPRVIVAVIEIMLRLAGIVAVVFTIFGGFRYILSQGEPEATKKAKGTIIGASVGLVITMFAAVIVGFVGRILWQ